MPFLCETLEFRGGVAEAGEDHVVGRLVAEDRGEGTEGSAGHTRPCVAREIAVLHGVLEPAQHGCCRSGRRTPAVASETIRVAPRQFAGVLGL